MPDDAAAVAELGEQLAELREKLAVVVAGLAQRDVVGPGLMVVMRRLIHGGVDRATLDLLRGAKRLAPGVRRYLVTTTAEEMAWADEVYQAVDGVFCLPDMAADHREQALADLVERLGVTAVLIVSSVIGYDAVPRIRRSGRTVRVISQCHGFSRDLATGDLVGDSVYAATQYDDVIDGYCVISRHVAGELAARFEVAPAKIQVAYCGADLQRFSRARRPRFEPGHRARVLWLGRLSPEKDPAMALRIARAWKQRHGTAGLHFNLVGSGELAEGLRQRMRAEDLDDIVTLSPAVDDPVAMYTWADCLMMTSRYEGIPLVIYESMAARLPIITPTRNTSIPEVLTGQDAYFVEQQGSVAEYLSALEHMLERPDEARSKAERAALATNSQAGFVTDVLESLFPGPENRSRS